MSGLPSLAEELHLQLKEFSSDAEIEIHTPPGAGWSNDFKREEQYAVQSAMIDEARIETRNTCHARTIIERVRDFREEQHDPHGEPIFEKAARKKGRGVHMRYRYQCALIHSLYQDIERIKYRDVVVTYVGGYNAPSAGAAFEHERRCLKQLLQCQSSLLLPGYTGCLLLGLTPFRPYCV